MLCLVQRSRIPERTILCNCAPLPSNIARFVPHQLPLVSWCRRQANRASRRADQHSEEPPRVRALNRRPTAAAARLAATTDILAPAPLSRCDALPTKLGQNLFITLGHATAPPRDPATCHVSKRRCHMSSPSASGRLANLALWLAHAKRHCPAPECTTRESNNCNVDIPARGRVIISQHGDPKEPASSSDRASPTDRGQCPQVKQDA